MNSTRLLTCSLLCFGLWLVQGLMVTAPVFAQETGGTEVHRNLLYRTDDDQLDPYAKSQCRLDLAVPVGQKNFPTILWFHGGGLTGGERSLPAQLLNKGFAVAAVSYRLSPQVKVATCVDDAAAATAWVFRNIEKYGGSKKKIVVSGHSAGGYQTVLIGLDRHWLKAYGIEADDIAGLAPLSTTTITHFTARKELGIPQHQPLINELAPLFHVRKDAPPLLLVTGDRELEFDGRYEENAYFWRMLKVVGHKDVELHELKGYDHGGMAVPGFPLLLAFAQRVTQDR